MPILQCRRCQCYDGCDLVKVSVVTKNLQKYNDQCELVTLEELLNGKMPRCYFDEKPEEPSPSPKPSPSSRPVTRGMKRRNEGEDAVPVDRRMEERNASMKNNAKAVRVCVGPEDGVVMEISLFKQSCVGRCEKENCGHCYAMKKPSESMKAVRRKKKQMLRKRVVNHYY